MTGGRVFILMRFSGFQKEIDERLDEIIEFSELQDFIENPVRTYSSGMYMRLAFSVAINVDADVLLIDEILAVGDAAFQSKCFDKLMDIKGKGTTIVIVSHSLSQIEQICERSIWIDKGLIRMMGKPNEVHPEYMEFMGNKKKTAVIQTKEKEADESDSKNEKSADDEKEIEKEFTAEIVKAELLDSEELQRTLRLVRVTRKSPIRQPEKIDDVLIGLYL